MYKAIIPIGGYKVGEEVPADKAEPWLKRYLVPPVEKVNGSSGETPEENKSETSDVMSEDYLARNTSVVKKNVEEDDLSQVQLKNLLTLEKSNKKRNSVIKAIEKKLEG